MKFLMLYIQQNMSNNNFTNESPHQPGALKVPHANADGLLAQLATLTAHLPAHGVSDIEGNKTCTTQTPLGPNLYNRVNFQIPLRL